MTNPAADFARAQTTQRIKSAILLLGIVASLVMAFPMMIGFKGFAGLGGGYVYAMLPAAIGFVLAHAFVFVRNRK